MGRRGRGTGRGGGGAWGGVTAAATELRARDGALPQSHSLTLTHIHTLSLSPSATPPAARETARVGELQDGGGGDWAGDTGPPSRTGRRRYLCQGELGRRSHGVSIMHGRGRKDGRTGARGGEEAEGAVRGEARAGGRASPLTSTTSLLSPAPPRPAPPGPARLAPARRHPNPGSGFGAAGQEPTPPRAACENPARTRK